MSERFAERFKRARCVFFDCDGVIFDSNRFKLDVLKQVIAPYPEDAQREMIDYWLGRRNKNSQQMSRLPGCMMYVAGGLGLVGLFAILISIIIVGTIVPAIILGAGVLGGFYTGFALLMLAYLAARNLLSKLGSGASQTQPEVQALDLDH